MEKVTISLVSIARRLSPEVSGRIEELVEGAA